MTTALRRTPRRFLALEASYAVSHILSRYRNALRLSQPDVERLTGMGYRTISFIETGRRSCGINLAQLLALLKAYGVTLARFAADYEEFIQDVEKSRRRVA